jgi:hypothetical protein
MIETLVGKFVVIEFTNGQRSQRTIAYLAAFQDGFLTLEAPSTRKQYSVNVNSVIEISELPESQVKPEYRR